MGHAIRAVIGKAEVVEALASDWILAKVTPLPQQMAMVLATDALIDDVVELVNVRGESVYPQFVYLVPALESVLKDKSRLGPLAYIETDYFGGSGTQAAILYDREKVVLGPLQQETVWTGTEYQSGDDAINPVLQRMGVHRGRARDEFDALQLGSHRRMPE